MKSNTKVTYDLPKRLMRFSQKDSHIGQVMIGIKKGAYLHICKLGYYSFGMHQQATL